MDRGVPTEEVLAQMRATDPPVHYLVGTPKGRLTRLRRSDRQAVAAGATRVRSSCCRKKASSTSSPKAAIASPKNELCADAS